MIQIARRLRCNDKRRYANIRRRSEAKHCSSLCSQSEGDEYCGGQTRLKIQRRYALKRWLYPLRVRGPHFASKVSYNAGAATDDYASQCKSPCGLMNLLVSPNIKGGQAMPRMKRWFACPPCFSMIFSARNSSLLFPSEQRFEIFEVAFQ